MPAWLMRLLWRFRGKRLVRLHLQGDLPSVEGILVGRWAGHYVLLKPSIFETADRSRPVDGRCAEVPAEKVVLVQVLS